MKLGFLGLGNMGRRMASRLINAGIDIRVWNRSPGQVAALAKAGAALAQTPAEAASEADIVISMVRDDAASQEVWTGAAGAAQALRKDAIAIEMSTLTPDWSRELGATLAAQGCSYMEAPVAGSLPQAEAGQLIVLAGGAAPVVAQAAPVLDILAGKTLHIGDVGSGAAFKLAVNALFGIQVAAMGELLAGMQAQGVPVARAAELLSDLPVTSAAAAGAAGMIANAAYAPLFPIDLVVKDFAYAHSAFAAGTAMPLLAATAARYSEALDFGLGSENINAVAKLSG
ncbi:MAG: NAD(P)-dependent oxidoreductase [Pseudomonadota bacterium]